MSLAQYYFMTNVFQIERIELRLAVLEQLEKLRTKAERAVDEAWERNR